MNWMITGNTLSDYLQACKEADLPTFKRDKRLTAIFEHASNKAAYEYLQIIAKQTPELLERKWTNDEQGNPNVNSYMLQHGTVRLSPSTLQYIYVLSNLIVRFGSLDGMRIVEIGGGYGGQCKTVYDMFKPACYHIIDLPEVCELQRRYCEADCYTEPTGFSYDFCISNYALSEIPDNKHYIDNVLARCDHGYITCNTEFVSLPWEHTKRPDIKSEREGNYILEW